MIEPKKWEDMSHAEHVQYVANLIVKHGRVENVEMQFAVKTPMTPAEIEELVEEATFKLVSNAPTEIRASMTTVISYHRWNEIYQSSSDVSDRIAAQKQLDRLMGSVH